VRNEFHLKGLKGIQFVVDSHDRVMMVGLDEEGKEFPLIIFPDLDEFAKFIESCRDFLSRIRTQIPEAFKELERE